MAGVKGRPVPTGRLTEVEWDHIAAWYAQHGPQHAEAAKRFKYTSRMMKKLYYEGHNSLQKPPIKDLMQDVELRARAIRNQVADEEAVAAEAEMQAIIESVDKPELANSLVDAAEARAHEGMMVSVGRRNITAYGLILGRIMQRITKRLPEIEAGIDEMTPRQLLSLFKDFSKPITDIQGAVGQVLEAERLLMGQPTALIGLAGASMDPDKAMQVLALSSKTYKRLQGAVPSPITVEAKQVPAEPDEAEDGTEETTDSDAEEDGGDQACDEVDQTDDDAEA